MHALLRKVVSACADFYMVEVEEVLSPSRTKNVYKARALASYILTLAPYERSLPELGVIFKRDHTTMVNSVRDGKVLYNEAIQWKVQQMEVAGSMTYVLTFPEQPKPELPARGEVVVPELVKEDINGTE